MSGSVLEFVIFVSPTTVKLTSAETSLTQPSTDIPTLARTDEIDQHMTIGRSVSGQNPLLEMACADSNGIYIARFQ
jgi:hypothetical protein